MLTDFYQLTMAYALWKAGRHAVRETFEVYFRKNPFGGEFTVFAGLQEVVRILEAFRYGPEDIAYLREVMPEANETPAFFAWLQGLDCRDLTVHAMREGSVAFPSVPLLRIEGPAALCRLLETTLLNAVNFPSLVATNAVRHKRVAGEGKSLVEGGLRRAQGPDGALSASRYAYLGGVDATSNLRGGQLFGIPVRGTHAHSFVTHFGAADLAR
ncbi:MAG TPA: nicotinate phosphoribosyltransferase, partial [Myxococcota bacterium]|nr:nicotinate phosphoribosyltransferase [Myxococcota bacterium]